MRARAPGTFCVRAPATPGRPAPGHFVWPVPHHAAPLPAAASSLCLLLANGDQLFGEGALRL
jgi:hypothetical protein